MTKITFLGLFLPEIPKATQKKIDIAYKIQAI